MKKFRGTIILVLVAIGLGYYTYTDFKKGDGKDSAEAKKDRLFPNLEKENITKLDVYRQGQVMSISKVEGVWKSLQPISDLLETNQVENYLGQIVDEPVQALEVSEQPDFSKYGLGEGAIRMVMTDKDSKVIEFFISSDAAFDGSRYLRRKDESEVFVGERRWSLNAEKPLQDLRSRKIFPDSNTIDHIEIQTSSMSKPLKLVLESNVWKAPDFPEYALSTSLVAEWITALQGIRISSFVTDEKSESLWPQYKIKKAQYVKLNDRLMNYGSDANNVYIVVDNRTSIMRLDTTEKSKIEVNIHSFRDKKTPFQFLSENVNKLVLKTANQNLQLIKKDGTWVLEQENPKKVVDSAQVEKLVGELKGMEVGEYGIRQGTPSGNKLALLDANQQTVFEMAWGSKVKSAGPVPEVYPAKTNLSKETFGIEAGRIDGLSTALTKDAAAPEAAKPEAAPAAPAETTKQ